MSTQIFVNIPVKDLDRSLAFYGKLGYRFDPNYTDEQGACMTVADGIYVMLLTQAFFQTFTNKPVNDPAKATGAIICLSLDSREQVDGIVAKAAAAGAKTPIAPRDHGFMYQHGFEDPDGHMWEYIHIYADAAQPA